MDQHSNRSQLLRHGSGLLFTAGRTVAMLALAVAAVGAQEAKPATTPLRLASDVWPPFTDVAGKPRIALDLVEQALERAGIAASTTIVAWGEVEPELRAGKLDGSAALWRSPERESYLVYSEPYLENRLVLVGKKGSDVSAQGLGELAGKRIAFVEGYAYGDVLTSAGEAKLVPGKSDQDNLGKLQRGEVDYMLVDDLLIRHVMTHQREQAEAALAVGKAPIARRSLHFAARKDHPEAASIVKRFNEQVRRMQADGTYNRILQLDWIRADVDGDGRPELVLQGQSAGETAPTAAYDVTVYADAKAPGERFYVDGKMYERWDDVPPSFKVPGGPKDSLNQSARIFSFQF